MFSDHMTGVIDSCLEEDPEAMDCMMNAMHMISSILSRRQYPKSSTVHTILNKVLKVRIKLIYCLLFTFPGSNIRSILFFGLNLLLDHFHVQKVNIIMFIL